MQHIIHSCIQTLCNQNQQLYLSNFKNTLYTHTHIYIICKSELHFWWKLNVKTKNTDEGQYKFCLYCLSSTEFRDVCCCCCCCLVAKSCLTHCNPWTTYNLPSTLSLGLPEEQEYCSELPFLLQGIFLTEGLNLCLLHWRVDSLPQSHLSSQRCLSH